MSSQAAAAFAAPAPTAPTAGAPAAPAPATAAPAPIAAGAPAGEAANGAQWFDSFQNADVKTWTAAKGFKDASAVAESAYNLEKLIGFDKAGRTLVIPKEDASPEEMKAFATKLGVPETPDGYKLPVPEGADPAFAKTAAEWMHKAGIPPKAATALAEQWNAFTASQAQAQQDKLIADSDKAFGEATTAWGKDAEQNLELGKRFAANLLPAEIALDNGEKVSRQQFLERIFNTTGATKAMLELFANAGKGMGEHRMAANGESGQHGMSPAAAQAKIVALRADQTWVKAYLGGDRAKVDEMQRLVQLANPLM